MVIFKAQKDKNTYEGKKHSKGLEGTIFSEQIRMRIIPVFTNQSENLIIHRILGSKLRKGLPQQ